MDISWGWSAILLVIIFAVALALVRRRRGKTLDPLQENPLRGTTRGSTRGM